MTDRKPEPTPPPVPMGRPSVTSAELLVGGRELVIRHGTESYRLLLTGQNKLILTK